MHSLADVLVPSLECNEYLGELRNIADNIVRERLEHSEVLPPSHGTPTGDVTSCDVATPCPQTPASKGTFGKAGAPVEPPSVDNARHSPVTHGSAHVGPAFDIPMTQGPSLEDLPSQLDFEWQEAASPNCTPAHVTARNLGGQLDVVGTPRPTTEPRDVEADTFVQVSQIAHEAVVDAMLQPPSPVPHAATTTDVISGASQI